MLCAVPLSCLLYVCPAVVISRLMRRIFHPSCFPDGLHWLSLTSLTCTTCQTIPYAHSLQRPMQVMARPVWHVRGLLFACIERVPVSTA